MQTFLDSSSPRCLLPFEQLPRGAVSFPAHIVAAINDDRARFAPEIFTDEYARRCLEQHTLIWYYEGLPVAYKSLPDGIEILGAGWEETAKYLPATSDPAVKVIR